MLGELIGSLDVLELGVDDSNALWFWDGKSIGTTLGDLNGLPLDTYNGIEIGLSEGSTEQTAYGDLRVYF